jgi:hypothetical protein
MAKSTTWTCDGCDREWKQDDRPKALVNIKLARSYSKDGTATAFGERFFDLCETCNDRLWEATDVRAWAKDRPAPEAPPAPLEGFLKASEEVRQQWAKRSDGSMKASDIDWKKVGERVLEGEAKGKCEPWHGPPNTDAPAWLKTEISHPTPARPSLAPQTGPTKY